MLFRSLAPAVRWYPQSPRELANAETLWLGMRVERKLGDKETEASYGLQLRKNFPESKEARALLNRQYE